MSASTELTLILFDGDCAFCSRWVRWIATHDVAEVTRFISLESAQAQQLRRDFSVDPTIDSIVCISKSRMRHSSDAALYIARRLALPYSLMEAFRIVPRVLRDAVYALIARHRHRLSTGAVCELNDAVRSRLIDDSVSYNDILAICGRPGPSSSVQ